MAGIKCEVITAERVVYSGEVDMVVAPGAEGQLGILPHHAPLMTSLTVGELRLKKEGEEEVCIAIGGGFMEVLSNRVTVLADAAERAEEIDIARAEAARRRAEERLKQYRSGKEKEIDFERAMAALRRSQARLKVAAKRRRRGCGPGEHPEFSGG